MGLYDDALEQEEEPKGLSTGQKVARAVSPYARPALEYGGAALGGIAALPEAVLTAPTGVGPIAAEATGTGLGYLGGHTLADSLDVYAGLKEAPKSTGEAFKETAKEAPTAAIMGMSGPVGGKAVQGTKAVAKSAGKLVETVDMIGEKGAEILKDTLVSRVSSPTLKKWISKLEAKSIKDIVEGMASGVAANHLGVPGIHSTALASLLSIPGLKEELKLAAIKVGAWGTKKAAQPAVKFVGSELGKTAARAAGKEGPGQVKEVLKSEGVSLFDEAAGNTPPVDLNTWVTKSLYDEARQ